MKLSDAAKNRVKEVRNLAQARRRGEVVFPGVPTGIVELDDAVGGYPHQLTVIGMATKGGKSSWIVNSVSAGWHFHRVRSRIDAISGEDSESVWSDRFLAWETGINSERIEAGLLSEREEELLEAARERLPPVLMSCETGRTAHRAALDAYETREHWDVTYLDYIQACAPEGDFERGNEFAMVANAIRKYSAFAAKVEPEDKAVVALSQFNNGQKNRGQAVLQKSGGADYTGFVPLENDLYGSSVIAQKCRLLLLNHRNAQWNKALRDDAFRVHVALRTRGRAGQVLELPWDPTTSRIGKELILAPDAAQIPY